MRQCIEDGFVEYEEDVPKPTDLVGLPDVDDYQHFLVAYGLAQGSTRWPDDLMPTSVVPLERRVRRATSFEDLGFGR